MGSGQRIHGNKDRSIGKIGHSAGKKTDQLGFDTKINPGDTSLRHNKRIHLLFDFEPKTYFYLAHIQSPLPLYI